MRLMSVCGAMMPLLANAPYADVRSSSVTSPVPSASDGTAGSGELIPEPARVGLSRRDADKLHHSHRGAIARDRQRLAQRVARRFVLARWQPVRLAECESACPCRSPTELGVYPCSIAAANSNGLNAEPGCRFACVARLNELV